MPISGSSTTNPSLNQNINMAQQPNLDDDLIMIDSPPNTIESPRVDSCMLDLMELPSTDHIADIDQFETAQQLQARIENTLFPASEGGIYQALLNASQPQQIAPENQNYFNQVNLYNTYNLGDNDPAKTIAINTLFGVPPTQPDNATIDPNDLEVQDRDSTLEDTRVLLNIESLSSKQFNATRHNPFDKNDPFAFKKAEEISVFKAALENPGIGSRKLKNKLDQQGYSITLTHVQETMAKFALTLYDNTRDVSGKIIRVPKIDQRPLLQEQHQHVLSMYLNHDDLLNLVNNGAFNKSNLPSIQQIIQQHHNF